MYSKVNAIKVREINVLNCLTLLNFTAVNGRIVSPIPEDNGLKS